MNPSGSYVDSTPDEARVDELGDERIGEDSVAAEHVLGVGSLTPGRYALTRAGPDILRYVND